MAKIHKRTSPYFKTPIKDFYLDLFRPIDIPTSINDTTVKITPAYHERPDLLAHDYYGDSELWWVIALFNIDTLIDPISDFKSGTVIVLPDPVTIGSII